MVRIQLAFRGFGVLDIEITYEHTPERVYCRRLPRVFWRQLSLWETDELQLRKRRLRNGRYTRGRDIGRMRLPPASTRLHRPTDFDECRRVGLGDRMPCPWIGCRYHLARDGRYLVWPDINPTAHECCALVAAARRPRSPSEVARLMSCSVGLVEAIYRSAIRKQRVALDRV